MSDLAALDRTRIIGCEIQYGDGLRCILGCVDGLPVDAQTVLREHSSVGQSNFDNLSLAISNLYKELSFRFDKIRYLPSGVTTTPLKLMPAAPGARTQPNC